MSNLPSEKLNLCFVSYEFPPIGGGIASYILNTATYLAEQGHKVTVITADLSTGQAAEAQNFKFVLEPVATTVGSNILTRLCAKLARAVKLEGLFLYWLFQFRLLKRFYKVNRKKHFQLLEVPDYLGDGCLINLSKGLLFRKLKTLTRLHSSVLVYSKYYYVPQESKYLGIKTGEWLNYKLSNFLVSPSETLIKLSKKYTGKFIYKFPLPVMVKPVEDFARTDQTLRILFPSRLQDGKGIFILIDACLKLLHQGYKFEVILMGGDTALNQKTPSVHRFLLNQIPAGDLKHFKFTLNLDRKYLAEYFQSSDICVVPSIYDNYPFVCLEAMAFGLPVIASSNTGTAEIVKKYNCGKIFKNGSSAELATQLGLLLNDPTERTYLGTNGKQAITNDLNPRKLMQQYSELLTQFIHNGNVKKR